MESGTVLEERVGAVDDSAVSFRAAVGAELPKQVEGGGHLGWR